MQMAVLSLAPHGVAGFTTVGLAAWILLILAMRLRRALRGLAATAQLTAKPSGATGTPDAKKAAVAGNDLDTNNALSRRLAAATAYVQQRGSTDGLDQHMRAIAEREVRDLRARDDFTRTLSLSLPIVGFVAAWYEVSSRQIVPGSDAVQDTLSAILGGSGTFVVAVALCVFITIARALVFRLENGVLSRMDAVSHAEIAGALGHQSPESRAFAGVVDGVARVILQATQDSWREQGQLWTRTVERAGESQVAATEAAVERFLNQIAQIIAKQQEQFHEFLGALEALRQLTQRSLGDVANKMSAHQAAANRQVELIGTLVAEGGRVSELQRSLKDNLGALASVQALDQAIHSLTAGVHLLTARSGRPGELRVTRGAESKLGATA
jgi:hypothetical protein